MARQLITTIPFHINGLGCKVRLWQYKRGTAGRPPLSDIHLPRAASRRFDAQRIQDRPLPRLRPLRLAYVIGKHGVGAPQRLIRSSRSRPVRWAVVASASSRRQIRPQNPRICRDGLRPWQGDAVLALVFALATLVGRLATLIRLEEQHLRCALVPSPASGSFTFARFRPEDSARVEPRNLYLVGNPSPTDEPPRHAAVRHPRGSG